MRILKSHPLLRLVNSYIIDASELSNLSYLWNFGSLLAVCLIIQILASFTDISYGFSVGIYQLSSGLGPFQVKKVYSDLDKTKVIFKENMKRPGIYRWVNLVNGSTYIGSASDLTRRFRDYFSEKWLEKETRSNNSIIYRALLKYGYTKFRLEILEYFPKDVSLEKSYILGREQYYLNKFKPSYNICEEAGSSLGRKTSDITRFKLKQAWLVRLFQRNRDLGLSFSEFVLNTVEQKFSNLERKTTRLQQTFENILNKPVMKRSLEVRMKILSSTVTATSVLVTDLESGIVTTYPSARNAALALNCSNSTIMNKLKSKNMKAYKGRYLIESVV